MSIDQFRASLVGGGQRSNQFSVQLTFPQIVSGGTAAPAILLAPFMVNASRLPGSAIEQIDSWYRGRRVPLPAERTFEDWTITITNDTNFVLHTAFNVWANLINNVNDNTGITTPSAYIADAYISALDRNGLETKTYKMKGLWPKNISEMEFDFKNPEVTNFTVTFPVYNWSSDVVGGL